MYRAEQGYIGLPSPPSTIFPDLSPTPTHIPHHIPKVLTPNTIPPMP